MSNSGAACFPRRWAYGRSCAPGDGHAPSSEVEDECEHEIPPGTPTNHAPAFSCPLFPSGGYIVGEIAWSTDRELQHRYIEGSEGAFGELVGRHVGLVYSTALRRVGGDAHLTQDVAQLVFTELARRVRFLPEAMVLAGWLHRAAYFTAGQALRTERRRRAREEKSVVIPADSVPTPEWESLAAALLRSAV